MPYVVEIGGRVVILEDGEVRRILDRLCRTTRICVWNKIGGPDSMFASYYHIWAQHNRGHSVNLFIWIVEAMGRATLPQASRANRLRSRQRQISRMLRPNNIGRFYQALPGFNRDQAAFVRDMKIYVERMQLGATRTVRALELTRDGSFIILQGCAALLTAGASSGATVAAATASRALMQSAGQAFVIQQLESSATRLGRSMAGENVTLSDTVNSIVSDALNAVPNAMLGSIVGKFMGPLTSQLGTYTAREIAAGSLSRALANDIAQRAVEDAVGRAIDRMIGRQPVDIRALLHQCRDERNARGSANVMANGLMQNRNFRRILVSELENVA